MAINRMATADHCLLSTGTILSFMTRLLICWWLAFCFVLIGPASYAQSDNTPIEIALLSDTQAPLTFERMLYGYHQNTLATRKIFADIIQRKPAALFLLGDVVSIGYQESRWLQMDAYLDSTRKKGIQVNAVLGNHDLMVSAEKGEAAFRKRFPEMVNTGYITIVDSIAFVLLNSNFQKLSAGQRQKQDSFYQYSLQRLDKDDAVKFIVVSCHHAPYSNSTVVGSDKQVQEAFVVPFIHSAKAKLFITGHAHDFEHFKKNGKHFLTIGGGGGVHQPLNKGSNRIPSLSAPYDPEFHYLLMQREGDRLLLNSRRLLPNFSGFENSYRLTVQ
jgi:Icc-related predicted phosphoesterase